MLGGFSFGVSGEGKVVKLPLPRYKSNVSVEEALNERQSVRQYSKAALSIEELSQVLWAAYGKNKWSKLTSPSAGALYPLTIYVAVGEVDTVPAGLYKYNNKKHSLIWISSQDSRSLLSEASLGQRWVREAPVDIIVCANYRITTSRYGNRGSRYVDVEVGHLGQNIYLQAVALGLGTVAVGAFSDGEVKGVLGVDEQPLYIMPVGRLE
ncbi:MAG: SagB/ThcOx family dehydrogenase [Candidatus Omnitrophota bacterium]|nr:MAG: SagB/ThcOx family dehydrogenase [Candidatus Omnitrophota bacterium]